RMNVKQSLVRTTRALMVALPLMGWSAPLISAQEPGASVIVRAADQQPSPGTYSPQSVQPSSQSVSSSSTVPSGSVGSAPASQAVTTPPSPSRSPTAAGSSTQVSASAVETAPDGKPARAGSVLVTYRQGVSSSSVESAASRTVSTLDTERIGNSNTV